MDGSRQPGGQPGGSTRRAPKSRRGLSIRQRHHFVPLSVLRSCASSALVVRACGLPLNACARLRRRGTQRRSVCVHRLRMAHVHPKAADTTRWRWRDGKRARERGDRQLQKSDTVGCTGCGAAAAAGEADPSGPRRVCSGTMFADRSISSRTHATSAMLKQHRRRGQKCAWSRETAREPPGRWAGH